MAINIIEGNNEINVQLVPTGVPVATTLFGVVTDAETGQPISDVQVVMGGVGTVTNALGQYWFGGEWLVPGVYTITFSKNGYETLTL